MIPRYLLLSQRIKAELESLEKVVEHAESAIDRGLNHPEEQDYFIAAAALDLHSFYVGIERLFGLIASEVDQVRPTGPQWHRDLLTQVSISVPAVRPAILSVETQTALSDYLEFRHVIRNVYSFTLRSSRVAELVRSLESTFVLFQYDLLAFAKFLEDVSKADQAKE